MSKGCYQRSQKAISDQIKAAFEEMDTSGDNVVTYCEFAAFCKKHDRLKGLDFEALFAQADTSRDGKLTLEELKDFCERMDPRKVIEYQLKLVFDELDTSGDGKLNKSEFRTLMDRCGCSEDEIEATFKRIAGDDRLITFDEFLKAYNKK